MAEDSIWRKGWTYVIIAGLVIAGIWWATTQTLALPLKHGRYSCQAVFVNADNKYEILVDSAGNQYRGEATVQGGKLVSLTGDTAMSASDVERLTVRSKGDAHFHATDDPAMHSYNAIACDY